MVPPAGGPDRSPDAHTRPGGRATLRAVAALPRGAASTAVESGSCGWAAAPQRRESYRLAGLCLTGEKRGSVIENQSSTYAETPIVRKHISVAVCYGRPRRRIENSRSSVSFGLGTIVATDPVPEVINQPVGGQPYVSTGLLVAYGIRGAASRLAQ